MISKFLLQKLNFTENKINHTWTSLTVESQRNILASKIVFQKSDFQFKKLLENANFEDLMTSEMLGILIFENISINKPKVAIPEYFIDRFIVKGDDSKFYSLENFVEFSTGLELSVKSTIIISDLAGSAKTTLLKKILEILLNNFPNFWVSFVSLRDHRKVLSDENELNDNFVDFLCDEILKLGRFEKMIFNHKFSLRQVVILFDGFDEASPTCKVNILKFFKHFKKNPGGQIWISTRSYLEEDLMSHLDIEPFKLKNLDDREQFYFLTNFWGKFNSNSKLVFYCAEILVNKMIDLTNTGTNLIGLMLQIKILADAYKYKLTENFKAEVESIKISKVFHKLLENTINSDEKLAGSVYDILKLHSRTYEAMALRYLLGEEHHLFGKSSQIDDMEGEELEEIAKGGIIAFDCDKNFNFNHDSYIENFTAKFIINTLTNFKDNWRYLDDFVEFFIKILTGETFQITRMFLDEFFEEGRNNKKLVGKLDKFSRVFCERITKTKTYKIPNVNGFGRISSLTIFTLNLVKNHNKKTYKKILEARTNNKKLYFMNVIMGITNKIQCEEFLDEIFNFHMNEGQKSSNDDPTSYLFNVLMTPNDVGTTIFSFMCHDTIHDEAFRAFWGKIEGLNLSYEKIQKIFLNLDENNQNFPFYAFYTQKENAEKIKEIIELAKRNLTKEDQLRFVEIKDKVGFSLYNLVGTYKSQSTQEMYYKYLQELGVKNFSRFTNANQISNILNTAKESFNFLGTSDGQIAVKEIVEGLNQDQEINENAIEESLKSSDSWW